MSDDVTRLAEVLSAHKPIYQMDGDYGERSWVECMCDSEYYVDTDADECTHDAHVAQQVAPLIAEARLLGATQAKSDAIDAHAELVARMEALADGLLTVTPPEFDSKVQRPEFAHERCQLPGCNLRPWGLGTVTPDEPRYCPVHDREAEIQGEIRAALNDPTEETSA